MICKVDTNRVFHLVSENSESWSGVNMTPHGKIKRYNMLVLRPLKGIINMGNYLGAIHF